jgi:hypothetical protein
MADRLHNEDAILAAVNRFLGARLSGDDVAGALDLLVAETSSIPLNKLDAWERVIRTQLWTFDCKPTSAWWRLRTRRAGFASWLDLCSRDGFRRERIMRSLSGGAPNSFFLTLAVRRLNDWVPQVRAATRGHLLRLAECSDPEHVVDALWHVLAHSGSWGRMEDADRQSLADLISIERVASALGSRILAATVGPATQILSQAGRVPALDHRLKEFAEAAIQPAVRAKAYRCLLEGRMAWVIGKKWTWTDLKWCKGRFEAVIEARGIAESVDFLACLRKALVDRSALVRCVAAEFLIKELRSIGDEAISFAERLASDRSAYVAERGRFALASLVGAPRPPEPLSRAR